jgi:hypothetical protein
MFKRLSMVAAVAVVCLVAATTASAATQTLSLTRCLSSGNGGTYTTADDIVATINWNTLTLSQMQNFLAAQSGSFAVVTQGETAYRNFVQSDFMWSSPTPAISTLQYNNHTRTYNVYRSTLTVNLGTFPVPGTYSLNMVATTDRPTNDGVYGSQPAGDWLTITNCQITIVPA